MNLTLIRYNAGNTRSVLFALERLGIRAQVTDREQEIRSADKVIFPGVGEAATAMKFLKDRGLDQVLPSLKQPVLGICLGMQLMCLHSEEHDTPGLGIFPYQVKRFRASGEAGETLKVPQTGWNNLYGLRSSLFEGIPEQAFLYFVHSYYVEQGPEAVALAHYGLTYSAALNRKNFYGVQFHPEKSAGIGERILNNFLNHCS